MTRILIAVLLAAAPAFARGHDRDNDDWRDQIDSPEWYGEDQPGWPNGTDDGYGSWDDSGSQDEASYDPGYAGQGFSQQGPSWDDFRRDRELSWNGEWIETREYGTVWRPTHVSSGWQPYVDGRWVWTRAGWAWASDEPFGWAVYHYGRWAWSPAMGWMWVPGRIWAPAWVSWRWNDGYAAWCPLGPRDVTWEQPALWVVVPTRQFLEPVRHHVVPLPQRRAIPLPGSASPRSAPGIAVVERATGRTVHPLAIGDAAAPRAAGAGFGSVVFYRPRTAPIAAPPTIARPARGIPQRPVQARPWPGAAAPAAQPRPAAVPAPAPRAVAPPANAPAPHAAVPVAKSSAGQQQVNER